MTRSEIIVDGQTLLRETPGSEAGMNPFLWDAHVSRAADDLARDSYCLYATFSTALVAGQAAYPSCPVFEVERADITLADGSVHPLLVNEAAMQDGRYYEWGLDGPVDQPLRLVTSGLNLLTLHPAPNFSRGAALAVTGFSTPGAWPLPTDCCPLPERAHQAVLYGAVVRRIEEYPELYGPRMEMMQARYLYERGLLVSEARSLSEGSRDLGPYVNSGPPVARVSSFFGYW